MNDQHEYFSRGEIWLTDLEPSKSHESARARLALIVSANRFNNGAAEMIIVLPITTRDHKIPSHVLIKPPEGGTNRLSFVLCERIQCIARDRLIKKLGTISESTMAVVEDRLAIVLNLFAPA